MAEPEREEPLPVTGRQATESATQEDIQVSRSVSVVIPARNAADTLGAQLEALMNQEYDGDLEIIVVDNGSSDNTSEVAERYGSGRWPVRVVHESVAGLNRARNAGIVTATGEFVLLCDADDVVAKNWTLELANALENADLVGGAVETSALNAPAVQQMWRLDPIAKTGGRFAGFESPWGCNCGFRRSAWEAIGGFDAELSYVIDEIEFFIRAQLAGFRLRLTDSAIVHYRLKDEPQSVIRRRYQNGIGEALVAARFAAIEPRLTTLRSALKGWTWLAVYAIPARFDDERSWLWRRRFAQRRGRLVGSIRYRVFSP